MCGHVLDFCSLEVPEFEPDCVAHCEAVLSEEEVQCLSSIECKPEEIDRCLGRTPPHRCEQLCPMVYDQCGKHMIQGNGAPIDPSLCSTVCPLLEDEYLDCLENATTCGDIDTCNGVIPPGPCEELCDKVYDECKNGFPIAERPKMSKAQCVTECQNGGITAEQHACLMSESCEYAATCFYPDADRSCAETCYWLHARCNDYLGISCGGEPFYQEYACLELCANGAPTQCSGRAYPAWSESQKSCVVNVGQSTCSSLSFAFCFLGY